MQDRQLYLDGNTGIGEYKTKPVHFGYCCCLGHEYREFRLDDVSEVEDITTKKMVTRRPRRGISYQQEVTNTRVKFRFVDESSYFPDMEVSKDEVESIDRFIRDYKQGFVHNQDAHQIEMRNMQQDDYPDLAQAYPIPSNTTHAYPIPSNAPQQQYPSSPQQQYPYGTRNISTSNTQQQQQQQTSIPDSYPSANDGYAPPDHHSQQHHHAHSQQHQQRDNNHASQSSHIHNQHSSNTHNQHSSSNSHNYNSSSSTHNHHSQSPGVYIQSQPIHGQTSSQMIHPPPPYSYPSTSNTNQNYNGQSSSYNQASYQQ